MAMLASPASSWVRSLDLPNRLFETSGDDYQLYEEDDEFVLAIEMPGFEREEIDLSWDDGVLYVTAEHADEARGQQRAYRRRFRFPKDVDHEGITAQYRNGVLEVRLPVADAMTRGVDIDVQG